MVAMLLLALAAIGVSYVIGLIETEQAVSIAIRSSKIIGICLVALIALFAVFSLGMKRKEDL
jgi:hypothetical protein